jgi:hypothetical protein
MFKNFDIVKQSIDNVSFSYINSQKLETIGPQFKSTAGTSIMYINAVELGGIGSPKKSLDCSSRNIYPN